MSRNGSDVTARPHSPRASTRSTGREVRALVWLTRHPLTTLLPAALIAAAVWWGARPVTAILAVVLAGLLGWWRGHPRSFDRFAAPRLRSGWRRWTVYRGRRWQRLLDDCELTRDHRRTGTTLCPRVLRVRSVTPSIDTITVRLVRGQDLQSWTDRTPALAEALQAHRVAVTRRRPGVLTLVVERRMPFPHTLDAALIPDTPAEVDLCRRPAAAPPRSTTETYKVRSRC